VTSGDDEYTYERFDCTKLLGDSLGDTLLERKRMCDTWVNEWLYLASTYREYRDQVDMLGLPIPSYDLILRANDVLLDMSKSLGFLLLRENVGAFGC